MALDDKIILIMVVFFITAILYGYTLGAENKENEILSHSIKNKKRKPERIDNIEEVKEEIRKGKL